MLTGQGAPTGKFPWYTKLAVMTTAVLSIVLFAIPASMLTWGFEAEAIRIARERYKREQDRIEREEGLVDVSDEQSDSTDSHEGMCAEDEEYFRTIAGIASPEDMTRPSQMEVMLKAENELLKKEAKKLFDRADSDKSNSLSFAQYLEQYKTMKKRSRRKIFANSSRMAATPRTTAGSTLTLPPVSDTSSVASADAHVQEDVHLHHVIPPEDDNSSRNNNKSSRQQLFEVKALLKLAMKKLTQIERSRDFFFRDHQIEDRKSRVHGHARSPRSRSQRVSPRGML